MMGMILVMKCVISNLPKKAVVRHNFIVVDVLAVVHYHQDKNFGRKAYFEKVVSLKYWNMKVALNVQFKNLYVFPYTP